MQTTLMTIFFKKVPHVLVNEIHRVLLTYVSLFFIYCRVPVIPPFPCCHPIPVPPYLCRWGLGVTVESTMLIAWRQMQILLEEIYAVVGPTSDQRRAVAFLTARQCHISVSPFEDIKPSVSPPVRNMYIYITPTEYPHLSAPPLYIRITRVSKAN